MMWLLCLLATYGVVFGMQHKTGWLRGKIRILDALLDCPYCLGFWVGWAVWLVTSLEMGIVLVPTQNDPWARVAAGFIWAFGSAAFCYLVEQAAWWLEDRR